MLTKKKWKGPWYAMFTKQGPWYSEVVLEREDLAPLVARGAAFLDEHEPGWHNIVSPTLLRMSSGVNCVLGQLERSKSSSYGAGYHAARTRYRWTQDDAADHGLYIPGTWVVGDDDNATEVAVDQDESYPVLTEMWREEIYKRQNVS